MENKIRLVQIRHETHGRALAIVEEPSLVVINTFRSVYDAALEACRSNKNLTDLLLSNRSEQVLDYESIYQGGNAWKLLPAFDVPENPFACLVAGTGLTHRNSALNRQMMHGGDSKPSDSIIMYEWGVKGGFPEKGEIGVQPEWFYKGNGSVLRAHGETLEVPAFANDGGEEPEIAGVYVIDDEGISKRVGFATGNEFSDHVMEKKNYLYLAPSKLRQCAIGPELVIGGEFTDIKGTVSVHANDAEKWSAAVQTGEKNMAHSLENLEYHHFKYPAHRIPLQGHVHFFGADAFSFGNQVLLENNDLMTVHWEGMGRALKNPVSASNEMERIIAVTQL